MSRMKLCVSAFSLALCLSGCGGRSNGGLEPVSATVPGASKIEMIVATTRMPSAIAGQVFSGERDHKLNFADIVVSIPPDADRKIGDVQMASSGPGDPARDFVATRVETIDVATAAALFHTRIAKTPKRRVLVFVHGFNTRFGEAVFRMAQIVHDSRIEAVPVLFTWPSRGELLAYTYDRESANYSRDALEALLKRLQLDPAVEEIDVLAHSMGNVVTLEALRQMAIRDKRLGSKIKSVMLASPDVDVDVFRRQIDEMGSDRPPFTLFVASDDDALAASRRIWGDKPRIGAVNPEVEPYKSMFERERITVIDLTKVKTDDPLGHSKFAESPEAVRLIGSRLADGQGFDGTHLGVGDRITQATTGAASAVGATAGLVISAPVALVDGQTRDGLAGQISEIGGHAKFSVDGLADVNGMVRY